MVESQRRFKRKNVFIPITYTTDDFPLVAPPTQALPVSPQGFITKPLCGACIKNSCADGCCFYTDSKLSPGTTVDIRMVNFVPLSLGDNRLDHCQAKVVWCRKNHMAERENCYEVGVQKIGKDKLPIMNMKTTDFASMKCV